MGATEFTEIIHLDFQQAKAKHLQFKNRLRSLLYDQPVEDTSAVLYHYQCPVGLWLYNYALSRYNHVADIHELEKVHTQIHSEARKLVSLYNEGMIDEARRGLHDMELVADKLVQLLNTVENKLSATDFSHNRLPVFAGSDASFLQDLLKKNEVLDRKIKQQPGRQLQEYNVLHEFFMQAPGILCILRGPTHIYELANPAYLRVVGNRDILGKTMAEALPELKEQGFFKLLDNVFLTQEPYVGNEIEILTAQGQKAPEKLYFHLIYQPLIDDKGQSTGILVSGYEVTEQISARKQLQELEERARLATEASGLGTIDIDFENERIYASPRYNEIFGVEKTMPYEYYISMIHPDEKGIRVRAHAKSLLTGNLHLETRIILDTGEIRWIVFDGKSIMDSENRRKRLLGHIRDVTETRSVVNALKLSEEKFRLLADNMPQFVWTADKDGSLDYFNQAVFDYSGLREQEILNGGWILIVNPDDRNENISLWEQSVATGKPFFFEHRFRKKDGQYRWQLSRATPHTDSKGNILMWVGTSTDIHDQKLFTEQLESQVAERTQELQQLNENLIRSNTELAQFAHVASHDLQEPLRKIQAFASRLIDSGESSLSEKDHSYAQRILTSAARMQQLILDLLSYSAINMAEKSFESTDLNLILSNVIHQLQEAITEKNALITCDKLPELLAIPYQMEQLFTNLLTNALKFSKNSVRPVIEIKCGWNNQPDQDHILSDIHSSFYHISVSDNGIGFDERYLDRIFNVFQRLHNKEEYPGTGIGLAICKKVVENHGGFLNANGAGGKGSVFHIYLPVKSISGFFPSQQHK